MTRLILLIVVLGLAALLVIDKITYDHDLESQFKSETGMTWHEAESIYFVNYLESGDE